MNEKPIQKSLKWSRTIRSVIFTLGCAVATSTSAFAAAKGQASIFLIGERINSGKNISVSSETLIIPSKRYTYKLTGTIKGVSGTPLAKLLKKPAPIASFVESISPGGSKFLQGTYENTDGTLPITFLNKKFAGTKNITGVGPVKISFTVVGKILADGTCKVDVTKVKFSSASKRKMGSIVFLKGSSLKVSAAPTTEFKGSITYVSENAGSVTVNIWRTSNTAGPASVEYTTVDGTANSAHYTTTSGKVSFGDREIMKPITVPILDNKINDSKRSFTIELRNPGDGALLGSKTSTTVTITDDE